MFNHVGNLLAHGHKEEDEKVEHENGPEHGYGEHREEGHEQRNVDGPKASIPELELGQPPRKGPELVRLFAR